MMDTTLPVDGWVDRWASYSVAIVRPLVTAIRNQGPLDVLQAKLLIKQFGVGADVAKASPRLDPEDGASRILNFFMLDIDVVQQLPDGSLFIPKDVTQAYSEAKDLTIPLDDEEQVTAVRLLSQRHEHLRRWIERHPFANDWRDGIVKHTEEEVVAMADLIRELGYHSAFPIVRDQDGITIDGHLRLAALAKLGINPKPFIQEWVFSSDAQRLAWYLTAHCHNGKWSPALRDTVVKFVNAAAKGSGIKMNWPQDIAVAVGKFDEMAVPQMVSTLPIVVGEDFEGHRQPAPVRRKGKPTAMIKGMLLLLDKGVVLQDDLSFMSGGERWIRNPRYGWARRLSENRRDRAYKYIMLTEEGVRIATEVWIRERPHRKVPVYNPQPPAFLDEQRLAD